MRNYKINLNILQENKQKVSEEGYTADTLILPWPEDNKIIIGNTGHIIVLPLITEVLGLKIFVDPTLKEGEEYLLDMSTARKYKIEKKKTLSDKIETNPFLGSRTFKEFY